MTTRHFIRPDQGRRHGFSRTDPVMEPYVHLSLVSYIGKLDTFVVLLHNTGAVGEGTLFEVVVQAPVARCPWSGVKTRAR